MFNGEAFQEADSSNFLRGEQSQEREPHLSQKQKTSR
ncbi:hypothetical protein B0G82_5361 [Paraburkholderia sp. BL17N1]|nr:hypothetical protein B0G82_5361 [Paraburkholderia sp. BL17N1]